MKLAKLLEEAKFHGVFFADVLGIYDVYKGPSNNTPALQSAAQIPIGDPRYILIFVCLTCEALAKLSAAFLFQPWRTRRNRSHLA